MNLGWYEILDRISMIQDQIDNNLYHHQESDVKLKEILDSVQDKLCDAYQYADDMYNENFQGVRDES